MIPQWDLTPLSLCLLSESKILESNQNCHISTIRSCAFKNKHTLPWISCGTLFAKTETVSECLLVFLDCSTAFDATDYSFEQIVRIRGMILWYIFSFDFYDILFYFWMVLSINWFWREATLLHKVWESLVTLLCLLCTWTSAWHCWVRLPGGKGKASSVSGWYWGILSSSSSSKAAELLRTSVA